MDVQFLHYNRLPLFTKIQMIALCRFNYTSYLILMCSDYRAVNRQLLNNKYFNNILQVLLFFWKNHSPSMTGDLKWIYDQNTDYGIIIRTRTISTRTTASSSKYNLHTIIIIKAQITRCRDGPKGWYCRYYFLETGNLRRFGHYRLTLVMWCKRKEIRKFSVSKKF